MKKVVLLALALAFCPAPGFSQSYKLLAADASGDDFPGRMDATELSYTLSPNEDSLYVKLTHATSRPGDFGFMLALDTNLDPIDGTTIHQRNMFGSPNTSMQYDILLYAYQNSFFPTVYTEAYAMGSPITLSFSLDTADDHYSIFRIPLSELGGKVDFNLIGFTGGFDITGSGPSDAIPQSTFAEIRESHVGLAEYGLSTMVYPNPANEHFSIKYTGLLTICDLSGKHIKKIAVKANEKIDCSELEPSLYLLLLDNGQSAGKLLVH